MKIRTFDFDGVIYMNGEVGVTPRSEDIIITGRCQSEAQFVLGWLQKNEIYNTVMFQPCSIIDRTRYTSGRHKGICISKLLEGGFDILYHYEDDPIQINEIKKIVPEIKIVGMLHSYTEK